MRNTALLNLVVSAVFVIAIYVYQLPGNPAGFYIDESSIAYNAYTISQTGRDEHGTKWPLFFAAFGEYKSPVYIYLLALLYRITGPSILTARSLSAALGILTAVLVGLLAGAITKRRSVGLLFALVTALTPWIFELSRVSFEVATFPALTALFLLCLWKTSEKTVWSFTDGFLLVLTLALLTYSYSVGRLLGPLLAFGLILFITRRRWRALILIWAGYVVTLAPAILFQVLHPEALSNRFRFVTYINPDSSFTTLLWEFGKRFFANLNPARLFIWENSRVSEIIHIPGMQPLLITTALLSGVGIWVVLTRKHRDAWWRYLLFGIVASTIPASLTNEYFHMLRLAALPVFLIVIGISAIVWILETRPQQQAFVLATIGAITLCHGLIFQYQYYKSASSAIRRHTFDADYPKQIFQAALNQGRRPIYLADSSSVPGYIQAYWYATLMGLDQSSFIKLPPEDPPPAGSVVISTEETIRKSELLARVEPYVLYVPHEPAPQRVPLPESGFRAIIRLLGQPGELIARKKVTIPVLVRNTSDATWMARERGRGLYQVSLGNHWLSSSGEMIMNDDGRATLMEDLKPGDETVLSLTITPPGKPGDYILELDMLQETVSWFAHKGSQSLRIPVTVRE